MKERILKLRDEGKTGYEIAKITGISKTTVYKLLSKTGAIKMNPNNLEKITKLKAEGKNGVEIMKATGLAKPTVYRYLAMISKNKRSTTATVNNTTTQAPVTTEEYITIPRKTYDKLVLAYLA